MDTWFCKPLGNSLTAIAETHEIRQAFVPLFRTAGCPIDMAAFCRRDPETKVVTVYFSPGASELARAFGARPCEKPSSDQLTPLVGDERCIDLYFPAASTASD